MSISIGNLMPPGFILWMTPSPATAITGYLRCDGSVYDISSYPRLFAAIGATYGGDGTTTFAVPNCNGRTIVGASGASYVLGATNTFNIDTTINSTQIPQHTHTVTETAHNHTGTSTHTHSFTYTHDHPYYWLNVNSTSTGGTIPQIVQMNGVLATSAVAASGPFNFNTSSATPTGTFANASGTVSIGSVSSSITGTLSTNAGVASPIPVSIVQATVSMFCFIKT